jgi:hypothetical protein
MVMSENLIQLQAHVAAVCPLLETNLCSAHQEWMEGKIARGAYAYCMQRHSAALAITGRPAADLDEDAAFRAGATLFIDLRAALKDVPCEQHAAEQAKVEALRAFYVQQGFTGTDAAFGIPVRPQAPAEAPVVPA